MKPPTRIPPALHRWLRFNLVGALGMAVQLTALALLDRAPHVHYLLASGAAVELAVLHNFLWHLHYTWRDRLQSTPILSSLFASTSPTAWPRCSATSSSCASSFTGLISHCLPPTSSRSQSAPSPTSI